MTTKSNKQAREELPNVVDSEMSLLGHILIAGKGGSSDDLMYLASQIIKPEMFFDPKCAEIYRAMCELWAMKKVQDTPAVHDYLFKKGSKIEIGDLYEMIPKSSLISSPKYTCELIKEKWQLREVIRLSEKVQQLAYNQHEEGEESLSEIIESINYYRNSTENNEAPKSIEEELSKWMDKKSEHQTDEGIPFGFNFMEKGKIRINESDLIIVAARPKTGKTTFALQSAMEVSRDHETIFFTMEMSTQQLLDKIVAYEAEVSPTVTKYFSTNPKVTAESDREEIQKQKYEEKKMEKISNALNDLTKRKLKFYEQPMTISQLESIIRRQHAQKPVEVIYIDQISRFVLTGDEYKMKNIAYGNIVDRLKNLAKELKIRIILISQIGRGANQNEDGMPTRDNLKDSGVLEETADKIIILHRKDEALTGKCSVKSRSDADFSCDITWDATLAKYLQN